MAQAKNKRVPLRFLSDTDLLMQVQGLWGSFAFEWNVLTDSLLFWNLRGHEEAPKRPRKVKHKILTWSEMIHIRQVVFEEDMFIRDKITVISFVCVMLQKLFKWLNNAAYSINPADTLFLEVRDINSVCTVHVLYMWVWRLRPQYCQVLLWSDRQEAWEVNKGSFPYQPS